MDTPVRVVTEASARVAPGREGALLRGFRELGRQPYPDGLLHTELLRGRDGRWAVRTLWRDLASLEAMRALPEPPAAPRLFRSVGAEPGLVIWQVVAGQGPLGPADEDD